MRATTWAAAGMGLALAVPGLSAEAAVGTPGPFAGVVTQGQTRTHAYDNNPARFDCIQIVTWYTVSLRHVPVTDTLTLSVAGASVQTTNGGTSVTFLASVCTSFTIQVRGTAVADAAAYTVNVNSGSSGTVDQ